ncbi:hypothetical protein [Agromyces sp. SYSU T0242]|uniref:hypothetical protein n=1 Tax=Agromyces litoreus TaxID=3158561 RepID=UPI00339A7DF9
MPASRLKRRLEAAVAAAGPKPPDSASAPKKKNYNQQLSDEVALALAAELRDLGMSDTFPQVSTPGGSRKSGSERRIAGGIGAKKVDVTWATPESGLLFAVSVKSIMFKDGKSGNFQKNLTNRRGDMLVEAVTLHRRFPYAVLVAFFILDIGAESDGTARRNSTFENAFPRLRLFTRRTEPTGREEQFERFLMILLDVNASPPTFRAYEVNDANVEVDLDVALAEAISIVGDRNFDLYDAANGRIKKL